MYFRSHPPRKTIPLGNHNRKLVILLTKYILRTNPFKRERDIQRGHLISVFLSKQDLLNGHKTNRCLAHTLRDVSILYLP